MILPDLRMEKERIYPLLFIYRRAFCRGRANGGLSDVHLQRIDEPYSGICNALFVIG